MTTAKLDRQRDYEIVARGDIAQQSGLVRRGLRPVVTLTGRIYFARLSPQGNNPLTCQSVNAER
jgi:hypothetical protein